MGKVWREYAVSVGHFLNTTSDGKTDCRVIALHLVSAALEPDTKTSTEREGETVVPESRTAVLCYNVRGVGKSGGRQPWLGAGEQDYGAVERWGVDVTGVKDVWRFVRAPITSVHRLMIRAIHGERSRLLTPLLHPCRSDLCSSSLLPYPR
jgi:hypothetical protein